jgi:NADH:ubiquinone oxidoreductase subunit F (NADH-binding)
LENNACGSGYVLKSRSFHFGAGRTSGEKEIALLESLEEKQGKPPFKLPPSLHMLVSI